MINEMYYFINIGSNLGDRRLNLSRAVRKIAAKYGWFELSHVHESAPWGYESDNEFMNVGMSFVSDEEPEQVLLFLQGVEKELGGGPHRNADGSYADRLLDIDIIAVDQLRIDRPTLQVPHPHLAEREFFLRPMAELAPMRRDPTTGKTCGEMLADLPVTE